MAFEPDAEIFTQYFFVAQAGFRAGGLQPEVAASDRRSAWRSRAGRARSADTAATWLWFSREQIASLDEVEKIAALPGKPLCAKHGARKLLGAFERMAEANVFYMNLPYGEAGAYVWI